MKNQGRIFSRLNNNPTLNDALLDISEVLFDGELTNDILKAIPGIKCVMALIDVKNSITAHLWIKKFYGFMSASSTCSELEKKNLLKKADENSEFLLEALDRIESEGKPAMLGKVFLAFTQGKITNDQFFRMSHVIDKSYLGDLNDFILGKEIIPIIPLFSEQQVSFNFENLPEMRVISDLGIKFKDCFII